MHVWIVKDMEPVPGDPGAPRLLRTGMLSKALFDRGHDVTWITSTFNHYARQHRSDRNETRTLANRYRIEILRAPGYSSSTGPYRVWHNRYFAQAFRDFAARSTDRPDVIATDIPTTETAEAAIRLAQRWGVPSLLSVRDLWPDLFHNFAHPAIRPFLAMPMKHFERQVSYACKNATCIVGISPRYLEWGLAKGQRSIGELDGVFPLGYTPISLSPTDAEGARRQLQEMGVDFEKTLVSFVGSWGATYDLDVVLDAAARLEERRDLQFVLAGDGDERRALMTRVASLTNVIAPGWLNAKQIAVLLEASALGLTPYRNSAPQGLPNKIFEYLSYGAFQISTLRGEAAELLSRLAAGKSVPPEESQAMAEAIIDALNDEGLECRRERIRRAFLAQYSADEIYASLVDRIERLGTVHVE